jgi:hypothetical protein
MRISIGFLGWVLMASNPLNAGKIPGTTTVSEKPMILPTPEKHIPKLNGKWIHLVIAHASLEKIENAWVDKEIWYKDEWDYDRKNFKLSYQRLIEIGDCPFCPSDCIEYSINADGEIQQAFLYEEESAKLQVIVFYQYDFSRNLQSLWETRAGDGKLTSIELYNERGDKGCPRRYSLNSQGELEIGCGCECSDCDQNPGRRERTTESEMASAKWLWETNLNGELLWDSSCFIEKMTGKQIYIESHYRYDYDEKGNWVKRVTEQMDASSCSQPQGEYVPLEAEYRNITYDE